MTPSAEKRTDCSDESSGRIRPNHMYLGKDLTGSHHHYAAVNELIYVVDPDDGLEAVFRRNHGDRVRGYCYVVDEQRGWDQCRYGAFGYELPEDVTLR